MMRCAGRHICVRSIVCTVQQRHQHPLPSSKIWRRCFGRCNSAAGGGAGWSVGKEDGEVCVCVCVVHLNTHCGINSEAGLGLVWRVTKASLDAEVSCPLYFCTSPEITPSPWQARPYYIIVTKSSQSRCQVYLSEPTSV